MLSLGVLLLTLGVASSEFQEVLFTTDVVCNVNDGIEQDCAKEITGVRSNVECLSMCGDDDSCILASMDNKGHCFHHEVCTSSLCKGEDESHTSWSPYCVHGRWDGLTHSCKCLKETHGDRCEKYVQNCNELLSAGKVAGTYWLLMDPDLDGKNHLLISCFIYPPSYHQLYVLRNKGESIFNKSWNDYVNGFSSNDFDLWVGFKTWHILSNSGCNSLHLRLVFKGSSYMFVQRDYTDFVLQGENTSYAFTLKTSRTKTAGGPIPGNYELGDCLNSLQNTPFSTWDADNDGDISNNCAYLSRSGWWYSGCGNPCRLMGSGLSFWSDATWESTPSLQRFSVAGVDMATAASQIDYFYAFLQCA